MNSARIPDDLRLAVWRAWEGRCAYTGDEVPLRDVEVDHVIPFTFSTRPEELATLLHRLRLPADFDLNSADNLLPTHHLRNRQKRDEQFRDESLLIYLDLAASRKPRVLHELERRKRQRSIERTLADVIHLVSAEHVTLQDVIEHVSRLPGSHGYSVLAALTAGALVARSIEDGAQALAAALAARSLHVLGAIVSLATSHGTPADTAFSAHVHARLQSTVSTDAEVRRQVDAYLDDEHVMAEAIRDYSGQPSWSFFGHLIRAELRQHPNEYTRLDRAFLEASARPPSRTSGRPAFVVYGLDEYTLLDGLSFIGRLEEAHTLESWVRDASSGTRVTCVYNHGGYGKSALAWTVLNRIAENPPTDLAGGFWWSFYRDDLVTDGFRIDRFVTAALSHIRERAGLSAVRYDSGHEAQTALLELLRERPYFFVLDGLERVLLAYSVPDPGLIDDSAPQHQARFKADGNDFRTAARRDTGDFLRRLTSAGRTRTLITSRLIPADLEDPKGRPLPGAAFTQLREWSVEEAVAFWSWFGITGNTTHIAQCLASTPRSPLIVRLLASQIAMHRQSPGDFDSWRASNPQFDVGHLPLWERERHVLSAVRSRLNVSDLITLFAIAAFRMPTPYTRLATVLVGPGRPFQTEAALNRSLALLETQQLISWDAHARTHEMHPLVRSVVATWLPAANALSLRSAIHDDLRAELAQLEDSGHTRDMVSTAVQLYCLLIQSGLYHDAAELYASRLFAALHYDGLGIHIERALLGELFGDEIGAPPRMRREDHPYNLVRLAIANAIGGNPKRGMDLVLEANQIFSRRPDHAYQASGPFVNRAICELKLGQLRNARVDLQCALPLLTAEKDSFREGIARLHLATLNGICGNGAGAVEETERAAALFAASNTPGYQGRARLNGVWLALINHVEGDYTSEIERAEHLVLAYGMKRERIRAHWLRGKVSLRTGRPGEAMRALELTMEEARAIGWAELELHAGVDLVRAYTASGDPRTRDLGAALVREAERCGYRLVSADALNALALWQKSQGLIAEAIDAWKEAIAQANCDGPPFAYLPAINDATQGLRTLEGAS